MLKYLVDTFKTHQSKIDDFFLRWESAAGQDPIYASVDLRNAGFKIAPVDTNIFPAGFNNLCPSYRREAAKLFEEQITKHHPETKRIAILGEEHTRNLFYFENLLALQNILEEAGYRVAIASLSADLAKEKNDFITASRAEITIWKAHVQGFLFKIPPWTPDFVLVNNDFSGGVPKSLKKICQPMLPTPLIGWHARKKSDHFTHYHKLSKIFCEMLGIDPWLIASAFLSMWEIDFADQSSMTRLATKVDIVLNEIRPKYIYYKIPKKPYVFVKNDAGTYGMAITTAESGDHFLHLNKKERTKMKIGKGKRIVSEVIIQEGIPTIDRFKGNIAEPVIYLIGNKVCGGFFRLNEAGDTRGNLNQPGMKFTKLCFHEMFGYSNEYSERTARARASGSRGSREASLKNKTCDLECLAMVYKTIARIASLAAGCEIKKTRGPNTI